MARWYGQLSVRPTWSGVEYSDYANTHTCHYCGAEFDEERLGEYLDHQRHCATENYQEEGL